MCYPKPGPRCASSSLKRLQRIVAERREYMSSGQYEDYNNSESEYQEALLDYYSTPAGYSLIEVARQQGSATTDLLGYAIISVEEYGAVLQAYRQKKLDAIAAGDREDKHEYTKISGRSNFLADSEVREYLDAETHKVYQEEAIGFIGSLSTNDFVPLRWITSDGSAVLNQYLVGGADLVAKNSRLFREALENTTPGSLYSEEQIKDTINQVSDLIDSHKREEPVVVYRGLKRDMFSEEFVDRLYQDDDFCHREVQDMFVTGETYEMKNFASTTLEPGKALMFAQAGVVLEIKARSVIPLGGVSNWGFAETEMLANKGTRYRIASVSKKPYKFTTGVEDLTVVQMEEID